VGLASSPLRLSNESTAGYVKSPEEFFRMARLALCKARLGEKNPVTIFSFSM
jgi:hypothetical protein